MARIARAVAPGIPNHLTPRGNRRQQTFFNDKDYQSYLELMSKRCTKFQQEIALLQKHERTGRPLGENPFIEKMELLLDRKLKPKKPHPNRKISKVSPELKNSVKRKKNSRQKR